MAKPQYRTRALTAQVGRAVTAETATCAVPTVEWPTDGPPLAHHWAASSLRATQLVGITQGALGHRIGTPIWPCPRPAWPMRSRAARFATNVGGQRTPSSTKSSSATPSLFSPTSNVPMVIVLPYFVKRELREFLGCGILAKGFLRVRCPQCRHDRVVAFSCRRRGFCPSCGGRRMAKKAAHLVDHVFPDVPVREWVLSLPHRIRYRLAYDQDACTIALRAFIRTVFTDLRRRAKRRHGVINGKPGGITFIQRFASSLALNVHFHSLILDGVYEVRDDGAARFVPLPPPTDEQVAALTKKVGRSVRRALARAGKLLDDSIPSPTFWPRSSPRSLPSMAPRSWGKWPQGSVLVDGWSVSAIGSRSTMQSRSPRAGAPRSGAFRSTPTWPFHPVIASASSDCAGTSRGLRWPPIVSIAAPMASWCICSASRGAMVLAALCSRRRS